MLAAIITIVGCSRERSRWFPVAHSTPVLQTVASHSQHCPPNQNVPSPLGGLHPLARPGQDEEPLLPVCTLCLLWPFNRGL